MEVTNYKAKLMWSKECLVPIYFRVVVSFGHRSAFPVMFDAESIEKWWKSSLVFKVYCKLPAQKMVSSDVCFCYCCLLS